MESHLYTRSVGFEFTGETKDTVRSKVNHDDLSSFKSPLLSLPNPTWTQVSQCDLSFLPFPSVDMKTKSNGLVEEVIV